MSSLISSINKSPKVVAVGLTTLAVAITGLIKYIRHQQVKTRRQKLSAKRHQLASTPHVASTSSSTSDSTVSSFTRGLLQCNETPIYIMEHFSRVNDSSVALYHPTQSPDGYISLCVAENKLVHDLLKDKLQHRQTITADHMGYNNFKGMKHVREAVANFLDQYVWGRAVDPEKLVLTCGANNALELIFQCICEPGDYVLINTPYYAAFKWDLGMRAGVELYKVEGDRKKNYALDVEAYKQAYKQAQQEGKTISAILLCNPNNPLGTIYDVDSLQSLVSWARSVQIHIVSDELYSLSKYDVDSEFHSLASILSPEEMGDYFHVIYGISKDFSLSGFRGAFLYTENNAVLKAIDQVAPFCGVSTDVQQFIYELFTDEYTLTRYIDTMQQRLRANYLVVEKMIQEMKIPTVRGQAGIFVFIDLSSWLRTQTADGEIELFRYILSEGNVNLTPGSTFHCPQPGWFRLCFAACSESAIKEACNRIQKCLQAFKQ